ncbi:hypothetical protein Apa02nite_008100 [Actinoplanes palleronii]|uniref:Uncharacterized protein n=1 Tax=Actinoplanes palleronii TaxID=113570 RepID=A0ABQ4B205_9ACTN|nr:hypothetical protein Apa02nite_008100 [Actinoplanes palleronii]
MADAHALPAYVRRPGRGQRRARCAGQRQQHREKNGHPYAELTATRHDAPYLPDTLAIRPGPSVRPSARECQ